MVLATSIKPHIQTASLLPLLIAILLTFNPPTAHAQSTDYRVWTDSTGKHKVNAKLVTLTDSTVTLEKADGAQVTLTLEKLSQADRDYVSSLPAFNEPEVNPFLGGQPIKDIQQGQRDRNRASSTAEDSAATNSTAASTPSTQRSTRAASRKPTQLQITPTTAWNYKPEPMPEPGPRSSAKISLNQTTQNEEIAGAWFSGDGRSLLIRMKSIDSQTLLLLDLVTGTIIHQQKISRHTEQIAISPSGKQIATKDFFGGHNTIDLWNVESKNWTSERKEIDNASTVFLGPNQILFLDESRLITSSMQSGWLDLRQQQMLFELSALDHSTTFLVTPTGNQLAVQRDFGVDFIMTNDGTVVGSIEFSPKSTSYINRRPKFAIQNQHLMSFMDNERQLWDLKTGKLTATYPLTENEDKGQPLFVSDSLVLQGNFLYHIDVSAPVWRFDWPADCRVLFNRDRCWLLTKEALTPVPLLDTERLQKIERDTQFVRDFPYLKRGSRINLDVDFRHLGDIADEAKAVLLKRLQEIGVTIDPTSTLQLRADVRRNKPITITMTRRETGRSTAELRPLVYDLMLVDAGRVIWRVHQAPDRSNLPGSDNHASDVQARLNNPSTDFFINCELPTKPSPHITRPFPGNSIVTADGTVK